MRRFLLFFFLIPFLLDAQNGSTVFPMPGFFNPIQLRYKNCLTTDNTGRVWIGMRDLGVLIWDGANWSYYDSNSGLSDNHIRCLNADAAGNVWVGTDTGGVCKFDGFAWVNYSSWNSPLPSPHVFSIATQGTDAWIGTNRGLAKFDGSNWTVYTSQNSSLPGDTVNDISIAPNGELLIGTSRGSIHFNGSTWSGYWGLASFPPVSKVYVHSDGSEWMIIDKSVYHKTSSGFTLLDSEYDIPWNDLNTTVVSIGRGPSGGIAFCSNRGALHEITGDYLQTYYPFGMSVSNVISYGCFFNSQATNEFWFVNTLTTSMTPPYNALMRLDAGQYNGLGLGITGSNSKNLNINQVDTRLQNRGDMFWNLSNAYYHVPVSTGASTVFCGALWVGGLDTGGNLHQAAMTYRQRGGDYFPGTLDPQNGTTDSATAWKFDRIWRVNRYTISEFQWQFAQGNVQNGTYIVPVDFREWPAIGNLGITEPLAPFVDVNSNGIYDPLAGGDYPLIKGDQELFCVFNDQLAVHSESGGLPLGIEVQRHAWAFLCNDAADSTEAINYSTFYTYDIINRSSNTYSNLSLGTWLDTDMGNWQDDMTGCQSQLNTGFTFNGDAYDEIIPPYASYLNYPPVQSTVVLDGPLAPAGDSIDNDNDSIIDEPGEKILLSRYAGFNLLSQMYPYGSPVNAADFYGYLNGQWQDSSAITYGGNGQTGSVPISFMYPDLPSDTSGWNEFTGGNASSDRTQLLSTGKINFAPGDTIHYTVCLVTSFDSINAWNTQAYYENAMNDIRTVQQWYAANAYPSCLPLFDAVEEIQNVQPSLLLYPNPANDLLTIEYKTNSSDASVQVFDLNGKNIFSGKWIAERMSIPVNEYASGLYFVCITDGDQLISAKFLKQ